MSCTSLDCSSSPPRYPRRPPARPCPCPGFAFATRSTEQDLGTSSWYSRARAIFARRAAPALRSLGTRPGHQHGRTNGEEFPVFTHFWIEQPGAKADLVIYALLESKSATGAYRSWSGLGAQTTMMWTRRCSARQHPHLVGITPLTSMFLFDETNRGKLDDYRPEVHDSMDWRC